MKPTDYIPGDKIEFVQFNGRLALLSSLSPKEREEFEEWESKQEKTTLVVSNITSEPKPECDHIVGIDISVDTSEYKFLKSTNSKVIAGIQHEFFEEGEVRPFYFCPKKGCGHPIDWEEIEKKLNTTK